MLGNTSGWIISAFLVIATGTLLYFAAIPPGISPPTNGPEVKLAMEPAQLPSDPGAVVPAPQKDCDAGDAYRKAASDWLAHEQDYEDLQKNVTKASVNEPEAVAQIISAADCGKMNLFSKHLDEVINYKADRPTLDALNAAGTLCSQLALLYTRDPYTNLDKARAHANAAFNLGRHLYEERISFAEWVDGISLMEDSASVLQQMEKDPGKADPLKDFVVAANDYRRARIQRLWEIISGIGDEDKARYAGDIFQIAQSSPERMWRVEATLKVGRFKFNAATRGDQYGAKRVLREMLKAPSLSPDPLTQSSVRTAAAVANDLTIEDYRLIT